MSKDGIVYLISGNKHAVVLVASIVSLRKHWGGSITVVGTDDAGYEIACKLGDDSRLDVISKRMEHGNQKRNSGYLNKTRIGSVLNYDRMIFLDADTIVCGDVSEVFPRGDEMVLTSWAGWVTTGRMMSRRIEKWSGVEPDRVSRMLSVPWAAINTGVFGFTKNTEFMKDWFTVTCLLTNTTALHFTGRKKTRQWCGIFMEKSIAVRVRSNCGSQYFRSVWTLTLPVCLSGVLPETRGCVII